MILNPISSFYPPPTSTLRCVHLLQKPSSLPSLLIKPSSPPHQSSLTLFFLLPLTD